MNITVTTNEQGCRMIIDGSMTFQFARQMEDRMIDSMRRHPHIEVDLSGVREIDLHGIHHLQLLQTLGGEKVTIVAQSPAVEHASKHLLSGQRGASLARAWRKTH